MMNEQHVFRASIGFVEGAYRDACEKRDEYLRRIELAVSMIDSCNGEHEAGRLLFGLRAVLDEGARPDLEPDEPDGTIADGIRKSGFTGGKP